MNPVPFREKVNIDPGIKSLSRRQADRQVIRPLIF
jgi:hypothetical protein